MEWIIVYHLVFAYCTAPEGQMVCEPTEAVYEFHDPIDCEEIRYLVMEKYDAFSNVIVDKVKTQCKAVAEPAYGSESEKDAQSYGEEKMRQAREVLRNARDT